MSSSSSSSFSSTSTSTRDANRPTSMRCSQCTSHLTIPSSVWHWRCSHQHENDVEVGKCRHCKEPRPTGASWPALLCPACSTINPLPGSSGSEALNEAEASLKSAYHLLTRPPATFHCGHCNTALVTPVNQPWVCCCNEVNASTATHCVRCSTSVEAQHVLCGKCHRLTLIPNNAVTDALKSGLLSAVQMAKKSYYEITGKTTIDCPSCMQAVPLPNTLTVHSAATGQPLGHAEHSVHVSPTQISTDTKPLPSNVDQGMRVTCPNCGHHFSLNPDQSRTSGDTVNVSSIGGSSAATQTGHVVAMPIAPVATAV